MGLRDRIEKKRELLAQNAEVVILLVVLAILVISWGLT